MREDDVAALLLRIYDIWPSATPPVNRRGDIGAEWCRLLQKQKNAALMNEALDSYATGPSGKYAPKPSDLIGVYEELQDRMRRRTALQVSDGKCTLCGGFGRVLVEAAEPFYGNYGVLAVKCPCNRPGELRALENGQRVTRDIKGGRMELWLENDRLYGILREYKAKPRAEAWPPPGAERRVKPAVSQSMNIFDDLQAELDKPPF